MKKVFLKVIVAVIKLIYIPFKALPVKNKILYISRQSDLCPLDFKLLYDEIVSKYPSYKNVILCRKITNGKKSVLTYPFHMIVQMYNLATSKVVILDGYCIVACILPHKKQTKIIQIWHAAAAIKKFGYQTIGKESGSDEYTAEIMKMHRNYDYVFASSKITGEHYCEAFNVKNDKIRYIGMPHFTILKSKEFENISVKEFYPKLQEKKIILYIPTFRKGKQTNTENLIKNIDFNEYSLVIRTHPSEIPSIKDGRVIYDEKFSTYEWIQTADIVIADYSSLIIESALLNKKIYFYLYDKAEYFNDPGVNLDFKKEELDEYVFEDASEFKELLNKDYDFKIIEDFSRKYVEVDYENSLYEATEFIASLMK